MLEKLQSIMDQIEVTEKELDEVVEQVEKIDVERLQKVITITKKGIFFYRIWSKCNSHNCNNCYCPNTYEYTEFKGYRVAFEDNGSRRGNTDKTVREKELFLLEDGNFATFEYVGDFDFWQNAWNHEKRELIENGLTVEDVVPFWNVDEIIENIQEALTKRLKRLGERTKTQQRRIEKLKELQI